MAELYALYKLYKHVNPDRRRRGERRRKLRPAPPGFYGFWRPPLTKKQQKENLEFIILRGLAQEDGFFKRLLIKYSDKEPGTNWSNFIKNHPLYDPRLFIEIAKFI